MKLLVTGGMGFIGSNFVRYILRSPGVSVTNFDVLSYGSNTANLADLGKELPYAFLKGDLLNEHLVQDSVNQADAVVNFAAESHVDRSVSDAKRFVSTNALGVFSILEAIRKARNEVRFVQVGTDEEYGDIEDGSFTEEDRLLPSSPYAASKAAASMLVHAYHRTYGLKTVITRCTNNFGPYQFPEKLIPKAIIRATLGMKVPIYGEGKNIRDWIYVDDHCEAVAKVLIDGRPGEVYNISAGNELANIEVVSKILEILGKSKGLLEHVEDRPGHDLRYSLDSSKSRDELGWKPRRSFSKALEMSVDWYLKNEGWWRPLADGRVLDATPWKLRW